MADERVLAATEAAAPDSSDEAVRAKPTVPAPVASTVSTASQTEAPEKKRGVSSVSSVSNNSNASTATSIAPVNFVNIPQELKSACLFCTWKMERVKKGGRLTKVPYTPGTTQKAATDKPSTFRSFAVAAAAYAVGGYSGIGMRVAAGENGAPGVGAIDIDHCIREDGSVNDVASSILNIFPTAYFERSPSGTGLRGFFRVAPDFVYDKTIYYINNRKIGAEVYIPGVTNRFVTVTGNVFRAGKADEGGAAGAAGEAGAKGGLVPLDMEALQKLLDTHMKRERAVVNTNIEPCSYLSDESVIKKALASPQGERFSAYLEGRWQDFYDNQSDADMSFVSMLAFWCGCDGEQMDRIFRSSGMYRPKWDELRGGKTYGDITIGNAVASCQEIYLPVDAHDLASAQRDFDVMDMQGNSEDGSSSDGGDGGDGGDSSSDASSDGSDSNDSVEGEQESTENSGAAANKHTDPSEDYSPDYSKVMVTLDSLKPHSNPRYQRDEIGIGNLFADFFYPIARYNPDRGVWYVYDGHIWRADKDNLKVAEMAKVLADQLYTYALKIRDEAVRTRYIQRIQKLQKRKNRETMLKDARSVHPIPMDAFDHDKFLFNCKNGTLDMRTLEFHEHNPRDFLTCMSGVTYDPDADCPRWHSFISEVMCGDDALASYLQRALGYALTGDTSLECLFILYGATSRNGKGTTMETFLKIMGDYGKTSNPEMLGSKFNSNSSGPSEEIARLAGVRFVNISEPEKKVTFNAALVKRMTGNDTLNARFLHENSFDFRPVFKIFINTNYLPNVTDMTLFESGRLKIIPFKRHFEEAEQDKGLKTQFAEDKNLSGIFNWCLEGYRMFRVQHLDAPEAVKAATKEYEEDSDRVGQFMNAWIEDGEDYEVRTMAVYRLYNTFCEEYGYHPENFKNFRAAIGKKYEIKLKRPKDGGEKVSLVLGCKLRDEELGKEEGEGSILGSSGNGSNVTEFSKIREAQG